MTFTALAYLYFLLPLAISRRCKPCHDLLNVLFHHPPFAFEYEIVYSLMNLKVVVPGVSSLPTRHNTYPNKGKKRQQDSACMLQQKRILRETAKLQVKRQISIQQFGCTITLRCTTHPVNGFL